MRIAVTATSATGPAAGPPAGTRLPDRGRDLHYRQLTLRGGRIGCRSSWLQYDLGQATATMRLTATDLGIGSGHSAVAEQDHAQRVLGFPAGYTCVYLVGPASPPIGGYARWSDRTAALR